VLKIERHPFILNKLASICRRTGRQCQAAEYRKEAVAKDPENLGYQVNLATDMVHLGSAQQGVDMLREIVEKDPSNIDTHSKLLFYLHYLPTPDPQMLFDEHKKWGQIHTPISLAKTVHDNDPDPDRKLRIGYISPDFRMHSVAYNFDAFLTGRNRKAVEVYGYGHVKQPDAFTEYFKKTFDHYRDVNQMEDKQVAQLIEQDKIDILVEVGGHGTEGRLRIMAYKPAPIQVDYGGINTTGIEQIDYRMTDELIDPPHLHKYYVEKSICLPTSLICYRPPDCDIPLEKPPVVKNGYITFGSFNNNTKVNEFTISLWAQVLKANPGSRFVMKFPGADEKQLTDLYLNHFGKFGITPDRIDFYGWKSPVEHLKLYNQVDIVLDTFPFNGCVTTLEGLWMGVPIISLVGENSLLSRSGLTILSRLEMEFFAVSNSDEFVKKATALANNIESLEKIRASMRQRMLSSSLCDAKAYASGIENAYRKMWHKWCRSQGVDVPNEEIGCGISSPCSPLNVAKENLSDYLSLVNGHIQINCPPNYIPQEFIKAEEYVIEGQIKEAEGIINTDAIERIDQLAQKEPFKASIIYLALAGILQRMKKFNKAEELYKKILKHQSHALILNEMANMYQTAKSPSKAMQYRKKALELAPENAVILNKFALELMQMGQIVKGIDLFSQIVEKSPNNKKFRSDYLWNIHHLPDLDPKLFLEEHKKWGKIHAPISLAKTSHDNAPAPDRRLRIGYMSADFYLCTVAYNFSEILANHSSTSVETYGYSNSNISDGLTEYFKKTFDHYRAVRGVETCDVVNMILEDKIDILVSMGGGHEVTNRFDVLAYKPAPIQVDYGAINTTGMEQVDYRFSDEWLCPPESHKYYVEETICLPGGFFYYNSLGFSPDVPPLPALKNGHVTFGSFNNNRKINEQVVKLWSQILQANVGSRLILKFNGGHDQQIKDYYLHQFAKFGIEKKRIDIYGRKTSIEHMELLGQIDIALDPYPFNGCMTTLDGLWMGVPIISLVGDNSLLSRAGLSILTQVGLEYFAASTPDEYVKKAIALAGNLDSLAKIRVSMRQRMAVSTLCDAKGFACQLEDAYRKIWCKWCEKQDSSEKSRVISV